MKGVQCYELFGGIALKNHAFSLIDACARKQLFNISPNCLVEVVYYLKQLFHLLYDIYVTTAETLLHFSLILLIVA